MDQQIKEKWITALTSGNYNQEHSQLKSSSGHCCLGVLADELEIDTDTNSAYSDIATAAGLTNDQVMTCIGMNDFEKLSFKEIAEHIKEAF
jgi:protoheme ferro-lyase